MAFNAEYAGQLHRHVVIWLDDHIGEVGNNEVMKERFRRVTYPLHTFTNVDAAVAFIREQEKNKISVFLIVSGRLAHAILPTVSLLECLIYVFIFCGDMKQHMKLATEYIEKVLMYDSDELLLISLTNEVANQLIKEANKCIAQNQVQRAAGLFDWADWLYNDVQTLQEASCRRFREIIREQRQKLVTTHGTIFENHFNH